MRSFALVTALLAGVCLSAAPLHADSFTTFQVSGSFSRGQSSTVHSLSGWVNIDIGTGQVLGINLAYDTQSPTFVGDGGLVQYGTSEFPFTGISESWTPSSGSGGYFDLLLVLPVETLVGYGGGPVCSESYACPGFPLSAYIDIESSPLANGALTPIKSSVAPTPEPSSLSLLAVGVAGIAGLAKRRLRGM